MPDSSRDEREKVLFAVMMGQQSEILSSQILPEKRHKFHMAVRKIGDCPFEMTAISLVGCIKSEDSVPVFISRGVTVLSPAASCGQSDVIAFLLGVRADFLIASKHFMRSVTTSFNPIENHSGDSLAAVSA